MRSSKRTLAVFTLLLVLQLVMLAWPVLARDGETSAFTGRVVRVADGDTLTVLAGRRQVPVRLAGIDAPEKGQPHGRASRRMLASMAAGQLVTVRPMDKDRYGRMVGAVNADGADLSAEMVRRGGAWAYRRYLTDARLIALEAAARRDRRGLWGLQSDQRLPPWEWREARRERRSLATTPENQQFSR